jgi:hypothetical protein
MNLLIPIALLLLMLSSSASGQPIAQSGCYVHALKRYSLHRSYRCGNGLLLGSVASRARGYQFHVEVHAWFWQIRRARKRRSKYLLEWEATWSGS